jgi:uncharacterized protein (DUF362 family)
MHTRRTFLKTSAAATAALSLGGLNRLFALPSAISSPPTAPQSVLAAVRDGSRAGMLDQAMRMLGGMEAFVKKGQHVLVKPNIGWDVPPERGANTHPELVARLVELCLAAGAGSVTVFDNSCDQWQRAYATSGAEEACRRTGATLVNGKDESLYRQMDIPNGVKLKSAKVHSLYLDSDVVINAPVLKHHSGTLMTACMKNLMGVVWDRGFYHKNDLHQCIADILTLRKPDLNVLDAYHPMVRNGPRGRTADDVVVMKTLLASPDIVAIDAAATKLLDHQPSDVRYVTLAAGMNLGAMELEKVDIRRFKMT